MVTQTITFDTVSISEIESGTVTAFLFSGTTLAATLAAITENVTLKGRYTGTVADIAAGTYRLVIKFDGITISEPEYQVELLLAVGTYSAAMNYGTSGGGGSGNAEQATSLEIQETVEAIAASIAGASKVEVVSRVAEGGDVTAYIGDDFRVRSDTQLEIPVADVAGALFTKLDTIGAANLNFSASRPAKGPGEITGTVADIVQDSATQLTIVVEIVNCGSGLKPDDYNYQIEQTQDHSSETDSFVEIEGTLTLKWKS